MIRIDIASYEELKWVWRIEVKFLYLLEAYQNRDQWFLIVKPLQLK